MAEGAVDRSGEKITAESIRKVVKNAGHDARITVLGHVQRGGRTSAFDRLLGSYAGAEAITTLLEGNPNSEAKVMALVGGKITRIALVDSVAKVNFLE